MIVRWASDFVGHVGFQAEPQDYDGQPRVRELWFDSAPKARTPDRDAVAAFLAFAPYISGPLQLPQKFSPAVARAMEDLAQPVWVSVGPIEFYPKRLPIGSTTLQVNWSASQLRPWNDPGTKRATTLNVLRSDRFSGALRAMDSLSIASNAWLHSSGDGTLQSVYPYLAAAVLFAEDLQADVLQITGDFDTATPQWRRLVALIASARLGLELASPT